MKLPSPHTSRWTKVTIDLRPDHTSGQEVHTVCCTYANSVVLLTYMKLR